MRLRAATLCAAWLVGLAAAQESKPSLEKIIERANNASPYIAAQGVKALANVGLAALPELQGFIERRSRYALSPLFVAWLGDLPPNQDADRVLIDAVRDPAFPWRPIATKSLARRSGGGDLGFWRSLGDDALPAVREACMDGLARCASEHASDRDAVVGILRRHLDDVAFEPRLAAAEALLRCGDRSGLWTLAHALAAERRFFAIDFGELARRRAWLTLQPLVGNDTGYDPGLAPRRQESALEAVGARVGALVGTESRPTSRASDSQADAEAVLFGLEVRSCRRGDIFLRVTAKGELVVGNYDLRHYPIDPARFAALRVTLTPPKALDEEHEARPGQEVWLGRAGCDFERHYFPDERGLIRVTVGLDGRPKSLQAVIDGLSDLLETVAGAEEAAKFDSTTEPFARPEDE